MLMARSLALAAALAGTVALPAATQEYGRGDRAPADMNIVETARGAGSFTTLVAALEAAGLDRVNVSLDTLRPDVFKRLTRRDRHKDVIEGLQAAREAELTPVKVNTVLMPGLNEDEAPDLLAWAVEHDYELRFIEQMPLDAQHGWKREGMVTAGDILASLRTRF